MCNRKTYCIQQRLLCLFIWSYVGIEIINWHICYFRFKMMSIYQTHLLFTCHISLTFTLLSPFLSLFYYIWRLSIKLLFCHLMGNQNIVQKINKDIVIATFLSFFANYQHSRMKWNIHATCLLNVDRWWASFTQGFKTKIGCWKLFNTISSIS